MADARFRVLIADPPWRFRDRLGMSAIRRGAAANYSTMTTADLATLPVEAVTSPDAVLALWTPGAMLEDGLYVLRTWGFTVKGFYTWVKTTKDGRGLAFGMGHLFRGCTELALIGKRGCMKPASRSERNALLAPALSHSKKPEGLHECLERMFPDARKLEMFARRARHGWTCIGNEAPASSGQDIRSSLAELAEVRP